MGKCWHVWIDNNVTSANNEFLRGLSTGSNQTYDAGQRLIILHIGNVNITEYDYFEFVVIEKFVRRKSWKNNF